MVLDIITAALIVVPMGIGMARGLLYMIVRFMGWACAMAGGILLAPTLRDLLARSPFGRHLHRGLEERFQEAAGIEGESGTAGAREETGTGAAGEAEPGDGGILDIIFGGWGNDPAPEASGSGDSLPGGADGLPSVLMDSLQQAADQAVVNVVDAMVNTMENLLLTVISFLLIVILIRVLLITVIRPISRLRGKNPVSLMNKVMGLAVGSVEGILLAFLFLAALVPVIQMGSPETAQTITEALKHSYLAGSLYDGNLLLAMFG